MTNFCYRQTYRHSRVKQYTVVSFDNCRKKATLDQTTIILRCSLVSWNKKSLVHVTLLHSMKISTSQLMTKLKKLAIFHAQLTTSLKDKILITDNCILNSWLNVFHKVFNINIVCFACCKHLKHQIHVRCHMVLLWLPHGCDKEYNMKLWYIIFHSIHGLPYVKSLGKCLVETVKCAYGVH